LWDFGLRVRVVVLVLLELLDGLRRRLRLHLMLRGCEGGISLAEGYGHGDSCGAESVLFPLMGEHDFPPRGMASLLGWEDDSPGAVAVMAFPQIPLSMDSRQQQRRMGCYDVPKILSFHCSLFLTDIAWDLVATLRQMMMMMVMQIMDRHPSIFVSIQTRLLQGPAWLSRGGKDS
jgi:hypothetical protein